MRAHLRLALLGVALAAAGTATAQTPSPRPGSYASRALVRMAERLVADSNLAAVLGGDFDLLSHFDPKSFRRLDDSTMQQFAVVMTTSLAQIQAPVCAQFLGGGNGEAAFVLILEAVDSATVDGWLSVIGRALYAQAMAWPEKPVAPDSALQGFVTRMASELIAKNPERTAALRTGPTADLQCWVAREMMARMAALPASKVGPLLRALFSSVSG